MNRTLSSVDSSGCILAITSRSVDKVFADRCGNARSDVAQLIKEKTGLLGCTL